MTASEKRQRRKRPWERMLVLEGFEAPTVQSWFQRRLGHVGCKKSPCITEADTLPIGNDHVGDQVWRYWMHHQLRTAIVGSVRRADWPRALALLAVYFKHVFHRTRTFRPFIERYPLDVRFPTVELLIKTLSYIDGGSDIAERLSESILIDQAFLFIPSSNHMRYYPTVAGLPQRNEQPFLLLQYQSGAIGWEGRDRRSLRFDGALSEADLLSYINKGAVDQDATVGDWIDLSHHYV